MPAPPTALGAIMNKYQICSQALVAIAAMPIASFEEGSAESIIAGTRYESVRDGLLSAHPWSFAKGQVTLPRLAATPSADFDHAYQLPADFLRALSVGGDDAGAGLGVAYRIFERTLHTNQDGVVLTYIFRPDESGYPPYFIEVLIAKLAAEFALPLTENTSRTEALARLAEHSIQRAKTIDAQQQTPRRIRAQYLVGVRG